MWSVSQGLPVAKGRPRFRVVAAKGQASLHPDLHTQRDHRPTSRLFGVSVSCTAENPSEDRCWWSWS